ncbi:hypothetical protein ACFQU2_01245 [Siccirubricoccus deserti]
MLRPLVYSAGSAVNLLYAAALLAAIAWGGRTAWRRRSVPWAAVAAAAGLGLLFLFLPSRIQSVVVNPGERLMYPALLLLLLALPLPRQPARLLGGSIAVLALSLTGLGLGPRPGTFRLARPAQPPPGNRARCCSGTGRPPSPANGRRCAGRRRRARRRSCRSPSAPACWSAPAGRSDKDWERRDVKR